MNVGCDVTFNLGHLDGSQPILMVASLGRSVGGGPVGKRKRGDIGDESHNKHHEAPPSVSPSLSLTGAAGASRSVDGSVQPFLDDHPTDSLSLSLLLSHTHTHSLTRSLSLSLSHARSLSLCLSITLSHTHTLAPPKVSPYLSVSRSVHGLRQLGPTVPGRPPHRLSLSLSLSSLSPLSLSRSLSPSLHTLVLSLFLPLSLFSLSLDAFIAVQNVPCSATCQ